MKVSLNRQQVDEALETLGTDLATFIHGGQQQGKSIEQLAHDLQQVTGVPFTVRTLYRWVDKLEEAS